MGRGFRVRATTGGLSDLAGLLVSGGLAAAMSSEIMSCASPCCRRADFDDRARAAESRRDSFVFRDDIYKCYTTSWRIEIDVRWDNSEEDYHPQCREGQDSLL